MKPVALRQKGVHSERSQKMREESCEKPFTLTEETVGFGGMLLEYSLLGYPVRGDRFRISVLLGSERAEFSVGNDLERALGIYRTIVRGRVTPCGLGDVLQDLCL